MDENDVQIVIERIQAALNNQRLEDAKSILLELHPADQADIFSFLRDHEQDQLLQVLDLSSTADLLEELEDDEVLDAIEDLSTEKLADVLEAMDPDQAADLIGDLPPEQASEVLAQMEDVNDILPLLGYPDRTAGGLMTTWYIALRRQTTTAQAIDFLRKVNPETDVPYYLYVVDKSKRLSGVVGLRDLIIAEPQTTMENIMDPEVIYVTVGTDQEEVAEVMGRYDLASIPVVDNQQRLVGVIALDDIVDVLEDETTEDILHLGAVESQNLINKPYWDQRLLEIVRSRFIWLLALFVAETFTILVLRSFEGELEKVVALSFFIPLLIGTGGNAGSQTVATVIRGMALREVRKRDAFKVWWREFRTGLLLGLLLGIVAFGLAMLWGVGTLLGFTVGLTIAVITTWSNSVASLVPILATSIGIDPTVASGPMMATLIDGTGLIIYFSLAALILPQL